MVFCGDFAEDEGGGDEDGGARKGPGEGPGLVVPRRRRGLWRGWRGRGRWWLDDVSDCGFEG